MKESLIHYSSRLAVQKALTDCSSAPCLSCTVSPPAERRLTQGGGPPPSPRHGHTPAGEAPCPGPRALQSQVQLPNYASPTAGLMALSTSTRVCSGDEVVPVPDSSPHPLFCVWTDPSLSHYGHTRTCHALARDRWIIIAWSRVEEDRGAAVCHWPIT